MIQRHRARTSRRRLLLPAAVVVLTAVAVGAAVVGWRAGPPPHVEPAALAPVTTAGHASPVASVVVSTTAPRPLPATPGPVARSSTPAPVAVTIPSLGVQSGLDSLRLLPDGSLATPPSYVRAGWYADGTRPGDIGPAAIVGHVDSYQGPGVFYRLREIAPGAQVTVSRADGSTVAFVVESVAQFPKSGFPTDVFDPTPTPELLLITCTGSFDRAARSYRDNLVVTAVPA